jgi:hypothetical protein
MTRRGCVRPRLRVGRVARSTSLLAFVAGAFATRSAASAELPDARDTSRPCRPTISCTAEIVSPGTLEVETVLVGVLTYLPPRARPDRGAVVAHR